MITFTAKDQEFIHAIHAVVAEAGEDHVYERIVDDDEPLRSCWYVYNDQPSCLIGRALHRIGVPLDFLARYEGTGAGQLMEVIGGFSFPVRTAANGAQGVQDRGGRWGHALLQFDERLRRDAQDYPMGDGS